jgi:hypothetical protein
MLEDNLWPGIKMSVNLYDFFALDIYGTSGFYLKVGKRHWYYERGRGFLGRKH